MRGDEWDKAASEAQLYGEGWRLKFSTELEASYGLYHRARAVKFFRSSSVFILLIYFLLSSGSYALMPKEDLQSWFSLYVWVGVIIILAGAFAHINALDRWFTTYVGFGSFAAIALSIGVTGVIGDPVSREITQVGIIYALIIVYGIVGLQFQHALYAGWLGGILGVFLARHFGQVEGWELLYRTCIGSSLIGMFLAYYDERRDREVYLQTQLLQLLQGQTAEYAGQLDQLSRRDALTGLANRRHFDEEMQLEWRRAARQQTPVAVLMIDVDNFKHYNDTLGHVSGDHCLRNVANMIAAHTRRPGELAVRYGGEEFLMLFPGADKAAACDLANRLVHDFRKAQLPQAPGLERSYVSVSIGVAVTVPGVSMTTSNELVCAADEALYEAKHAGRDDWRYFEGLCTPMGRSGTPTSLSR
jgi:diguanylate cyclase (GGDEF)-like protein